MRKSVVWFKLVTILAMLTIPISFAQPSQEHSLDVSFNVALVSVSPVFSATSGGAALAASASGVVFDDDMWSTIGAAASDPIDRFSSINYTLAHKAGGVANTVSVLLSLGTGDEEELRDMFAALKVSLVVSEGDPRNGVVGESVLLKDYAVSPVARTIIQTTDTTNGVAALNVPLRYTFTIDVTEGPSFDDATLTMTYTATAAAP
jgi:hypothetical protein